MSYDTKQKRLIGITEAYRKATGKTSFTTKEVAAWAMRHGLYPVPKRGDLPVVCAEWMHRLAKAEES